MAGLLASPGVFGLIGSSVSREPPSAFALARRAADEAEILSIGVVPEARGRGLGLATLDQLLLQARELAVCAMFLEVAADNAVAIRLYSGAGFAKAGVRKGYYERKTTEPVDAHVMKLVL
jgi:[ribosomal protein S18]-alanine N-acetyltransferase